VPEFSEFAGIFPLASGCEFCLFFIPEPEGGGGAGAL